MNIILKKAKNYKIVPPKTIARYTPYLSTPQVLVPNANTNTEKLPDDISTFPRQQTVPMPEAIPYAEGKYTPASTPLVNGYLPYNEYLHKGKIYWYCTCGISSNNPFCDSTCNKTITRNRPIYFNVSESGYYKLCNCKLSSNAPFCNGTHKQYMKYYVSTHRGFYEVAGLIMYSLSWVYVFWNFYT